MREIPGQWKAQIVAVAQPQPAWWREWLWPCPRAWAGLAAAWLVILGMNLAAGKNPSRPGTATLAFSRQELLELRQQQQMLAKLISPGEAAETEPPRQVPAPRSERRITVIAI
jgi:hypothetical protein